MKYAENHPAMDDPNAWVPYRYYPSLPAAAVGVGLFGLCTILHTFILCRWRSWYFIPFVIGGIFEAVGYGARTWSSNNIWILEPYIIQSILLLVAPALFAASMYIILGRIILHVDGDKFSIIPRRWLVRLFVCGDVIAFLLQAGGGGYQAAGTLTSLHIGDDIIIAGLVAQILFFGLFVVASASFHFRFASYCKVKEGSKSKEPARRDWKRHICALYCGSALIFVRSIFRLIEYTQGNNGFLLRHEIFLYIFDGLLMLAVMLLFLVIHPTSMTRQHAREEWRLLSRERQSEDGV